MEMDIKREARAQYFKYFSVWFIILAVLLVVAGAKFVKNALEKDEVRTNLNAPEERVYDNADVLSDEEEDKLRKLIAEAESEIHCDIVLMTINQPVEGSAAQQEYDYRYTDWDRNMRDIADDFLDYEGYGYDDKDFSGALLLDNWYEDQEGTWLSTTGAVYEKFGDYEINEVLDEVYYTIIRGGTPYEAYKDGIEKIVYLMKRENSVAGLGMSNFILAAIFVPIIVAAIFIASKLKVKEGKVTTTSNTYVDGAARLNGQRDDFIRKSVSTRIIQSDSGGGRSGGRSGGRGGSHRSSSGRSHGGGGRRR